jgi:outer membrane protein TolC
MNRLIKKQMRIPSICIILSAVFFSSGLLFAEEGMKLTLADCIARGLKNNATLQGAEFNNAVAAAFVKEATMLYLPSLTVSAGYSRVNPQDEFSIPTPPVGSFLLSPSIEDNWLFRVELRQNIFSGFRIASAVSQAQALSAAGNANYALEKENTVFTVTKTYLELAKAVLSLDVLKENTTTVRARLNEVKQLAAQGLVTNNEVLKCELELSSALMDEIDGDSALRLASSRLNVLIGLPLETVTRIDRFVPLTGEEKLKDLDSYVSEAFSKRPEIAAAEADVNANEASAQAAASPLYPAVILKGNYTFANPNPTVFPRSAEWKGSWEVGLALAFDIGAYPGTFFRMEGAAARLEYAKKRLQQIREAISLEMLKSYLDLTKNRERLAVAAKMLDSAAENLRVMAEKNKNGLATNTDVLDARIQHLKAKLTFTKTEIDDEIARIGFLHARGESWDKQ